MTNSFFQLWLKKLFNILGTMDQEDFKSRDFLDLKIWCEQKIMG